MSLGCAHTIHARQHHFGWSRDHEPTMRAAPGDTVEFDCVDSGGGQLTPRTCSSDVESFDMSRFAPLTGPLFVDGAEPGDALELTLLEFAPSGWGWSLISSMFGILRDQFTEPYVKIWHYERALTEPAMYNDVARVPLKPFPGIIGVSPSAPGVHGALPPRNVGGNLDTRDISRGSRLYLPVEVPGALLSLGDTHAVQGNGELAGTALESPMSVALKVDVIKQARLPGPRILTEGPVSRHMDGSGYLVTCGVADDLVQACRDATRHMIDLLTSQHALAPVDAYLLCSVCGDLCISQMVNLPTYVVSLYFPRVVFE